MTQVCGTCGGFYNDQCPHWPRCSPSMETRIHRVIVGAPITPLELRLAGVFALIWFAVDIFWFFSTAFHLFGF
jgi:hypothetical protein